MSKIGDLLLAVRENPSIQSLTTDIYGNNPRVMYHLLADGKLLKELTLHGDITKDLAMSIMAGMKQNSLIKTLVLGVPSGHGDIIVCGLGPSVEVLYLYFDYKDACVSESVSRMLHVTPTLTKVEINDGHLHRAVFFHLGHPACTNLKSLSLHMVSISAGTTGTLPLMEEQVNTSLKSLQLYNVRFVTPRDVRLLWHMTGLEELDIDGPPTYESPSDTQDDFLEWAELIRRNRELAKISLNLKIDQDDTFARGVLHGARNHEALTTLRISTWLLEHVCSWLSEMLQVTVSLKQLHFDWIQFDREVSTALIHNIHLNRSVEVVSYFECKDGSWDACGHFSSSTPELHNKKAIFSNKYRPQVLATCIGGAIGQTLSQVFESNNTSLVKLVLPNMELRDGRMAKALTGLHGNMALKYLTFQDCLLDNDAIIAVGRALESTDIALEEIGGLVDVPPITIFEEGAQRAFLQSLVKMPTINKVHFRFSAVAPGDELSGMLLRAVIENKNIRVLDCHWGSCGDSERRLVMTKVEYYLKLNRFGRSLLDSPNVSMRRWPLILSQKTLQQPENVDAWFYFVKEYFARKKETEAATASTDQSPPQKKGARFA